MTPIPKSLFLWYVPDSYTGDQGALWRSMCDQIGSVLARYARHRRIMAIGAKEIHDAFLEKVV